MKQLLFLGATALFLSFTSSESKTVYICNNGSTKVYHLSKECRGLKLCTSGVKPLKLEEAKGKGLRLCGYED